MVMVVDGGDADEDDEYAHDDAGVIGVDTDADMDTREYVDEGTGGDGDDGDDGDGDGGDDGDDGDDVMM